MALFVKQTEPRSELRTKVSADLQERMRKTAQLDPQDPTQNASILQNQHQTSRFSWLIIAIVVVVVLVGGFFLLID